MELSTRLSGGFVKLAIFILQILVESGTQPAVELARQLTIQTFLKKFVPHEMFLSLQALSVLARTGWEEDLRKEAEAVAKFVSLPFPQLQRETKRLRGRGIVVPRGRYLYVSPDLLAVNAVADLWDTMDPEVIKLVGEFPVTEAVASRILLLPIYPGISNQAIVHVSAEIHRFGSKLST